ncbi:alpha/beta hydrolase [Sphaerisporangium rufum]|nr:alpha/beta hydrolase [Sphaerisporangium rufum]
MNAGEARLTRRWARRAALAGAWLACLIALGAAATALLPMPSLDLWAVGMLAVEFSLVFAVLAVLGAVLAGYARRGAVCGATAAVVANSLLAVTALLPPVTAWATARAQGAPLTLSGYLDGLSTSAPRGPDATVRYARVDGTDLMLDVWRPRSTGAGPLPAVVNVHGGAQDTAQSPFPRWDAWLADTGHVVFDIDYRFFRPHDWRTTPGDVKCALGWVARNAGRYGADPDRLVVMGQSAGGYLALLAAYTRAAELPPTCQAPEAKVAAVIAWYAPSDMTAPIPASFRLAGPVRRELSGQIWPLAPESARRASPATYLRPGLPPTLLIQGGRDILQPSADTRDFAARLAGAGVRAELVEIPYADHQFDLSWGGFGSQIARHAITAYLRRIAGTAERAAGP